MVSDPVRLSAKPAGSLRVRRKPQGIGRCLDFASTIACQPIRQHSRGTVTTESEGYLVETFAHLAETVRRRCSHDKWGAAEDAVAAGVPVWERGVAS